MHLKFAWLAASALIVATPAAAAGLVSYGMATADAMVESDGHRFSIYVHPKEDRLLIQTKLSELKNHPQDWPIGVWRKAAETFVAPVGCGIPEVEVQTKQGASWEATYLCPAGVDLRALILAQRPQLKKGAALKAP